jgi:hypothetical protein
MEKDRGTELRALTRRRYLRPFAAAGCTFNPSETLVGSQARAPQAHGPARWQVIFYGGMACGGAWHRRGNRTIEDLPLKRNNAKLSIVANVSLTNNIMVRSYWDNKNDTFVLKL